MDRESRRPTIVIDGKSVLTIRGTAWHKLASTLWSEMKFLTLGEPPSSLSN